MNELERLRLLLEEEKSKTLALNKTLLDRESELAALREASKVDLYKTVIESANDIVFKTDINGFFTYVNPAAEKTIGYSQSEIIGMNFQSVIQDDFKETIRETYVMHFKLRSPSWYSEFQVVHKNGKHIWIGQNVQPIWEGKYIVGFTAIARDITDRVLVQEQLNLLNSQFASIFNNLSVGLLLEDENRKIILTNQFFCDLFGMKIPPESLIGVDCKSSLESMEGFFSDGIAQIAKFNNCVEKRALCLGSEVPLTDGRILECDYIPIFAGKKYVGHLWKYKDVTERVNSQRILQQNEEKYRLIIQNMNLGLLVVDNNGLVMDANPSFSDMTGYKHEELVGQSAVSILSPDTKNDIVEDVVELRKQGISNAYEIEVKNRKGEKRWMLVSGSPIFDSHNKMIGSIGIHLDITERKQQMAELIEARLKAEQSARSKEMFLANMSHEIRTPMNVIQGMARLLEEASLSQKQKEYLDAIQISSQHLLVIINDILDFSKIDLEKMELENAAFSLEPMLKNLILQFEIKAQEKNLVFEHNVDVAVSPIFIGDSVRLIQILNNLLGNSIKFTNEGKVAFQCNLVEDTADAQLLKFVITDTGIGIDEDKRELIFESFMQENSSINRRYGGTGLGLSISRQLVQLFGGKLEFESKKGQGSVFSFCIKLKKGSPSDFVQTPESSSIDMTVLKGKKVLLAEDNQLNQYLATIILEKMGMEVSVVNNGYEAIETIIDNEFDMVLMDLQMPGIDGLAATYMIRNKLRDKVPIIALTANAVKGDRERCLKAGMNDYVSKPIDANELGFKIASLLIANQEKPVRTQIAVSSEEPMYNLEKLRKDVGGDEAFVENMIQLFCELCDETIQNIDNAIAERKYDLIKKYAHKIKSSIDTMEIEELKPKVREIENAQVIDEAFVKDKIEHFKGCLNFACLLLKKNELNK